MNHVLILLSLSLAVAFTASIGSGYVEPMPYRFNYQVKDDESKNDYGHQANSDGRVVTGSYRVLLPDGRTQIVTYRADENGYVADVKYEGTNTKAQEYQYSSTTPAWTPTDLVEQEITTEGYPEPESATLAF